MKKLIFLLMMITLLSSTAYSQVEQQTVSNKYVYCELLGIQKLFSSKLNINVDFGQETKWYSSKNRTLVDENNEDVISNSMVDAMNYMGMRGWELSQAYIVGNAQSGYTYHWLLKKDISKLSIDDQKAYLNLEIKTNK